MLVQLHLLAAKSPFSEWELRHDRRQCQTPGIPITTYGAFRAANTLFKHPDHVKRCYALSGVYDLRCGNTSARTSK